MSNPRNPEIIAYITAKKERIITGNPLCLHIEDINEQKQIVSDLSRSLRANVIQLKNGDYIIITVL